MISVIMKLTPIDAKNIKKQHSREFGIEYGKPVELNGSKGTFKYYQIYPGMHESRLGVVCSPLVIDSKGMVSLKSELNYNGIKIPVVLIYGS